ncbi:helix-turn-helix domain-containing protein [Thioclava kandeliae]|uniref:Helix-turn-helix domain-containing protein n=1 Tax=Thioclava kandeliae TaxID=3070818 RepID=A0ABV1SFD2_9RHOB
MSVKIMTSVFDSASLGPTHRLIMLALADHADDAGRCYPSIGRIAARTGLSIRAVQSNIRQLCEMGNITINFGVGPGGSNVYFVSVAPDDVHDMTPAPHAPPAADAPRSSCAGGVHMTALPPAGAAPKPSRTIIEPSEKNARAQEEVLSILCEVVPEGTAKAFIEHRRGKSKLTANAARIMVKKLISHPDPVSVFEASIMNGWTGIFPDKTHTQPKGNRHHERLATDHAIHRLADGLAEGSVSLGTENRDPLFGIRRGPQQG